MRMITVRVPDSLHHELLEEAKREGVSLNQLCLTKLARPLNWYRQREEEKPEGILDTGLLRNIKKSRIYAFLKGVIDAGVRVKSKEDVFPDEGRIKGGHLKNKVDFDKIKENIEKKFV